ncbi:unnamed protein product [Bursaphelenchus xylophilus]|uniref:(pine wood nematode) hypothetical protein n=1 Tax=Bursaphelenchus xylophilus TaxID=6326 RepID=A0A1I7SX55_BURXY|nr:unnamed protein product [Bursaphelenchus xylophilus]CAG9100182.1 unnamed protein product [Bursaphelenchus xylophilus]
MVRTLWALAPLSIAILVTHVHSAEVTVEASLDARPKAFAAPTGFNSIDVSGQTKNYMKIPGGYRDGFQKVIFDEIPLNGVPRIPDIPDGFDRFGAYDDGNVITDITKEDSLFVPLPYRSDKEKQAAKEEAKRIKEAQRLQNRVNIPSSPNSATFIPNKRPLVANGFQPNQQVTLQPRPAVQQPAARPPPPLSPPQIPVRRPFIQPPQQPPRAPFQPQTTQFTQRVTQTPPTAPFIPQSTFAPPQQFTMAPNFISTVGFRTPAQFRTSQTPPAFRSFSTQQTVQQQFFTTQRPTFVSTTPVQQQTPFRQLRPFRPQQNQEPRQGDGIRTGTCHHTIYYKSRDVLVSDVQQPLTHFAVVVSVDQCARTCHEFNCARALFDPSNRHCQFNPSTLFSQRGFCEQWPNNVYRNNVPLGPRPVVIECVTCQRRRRNGNPFLRPQRQQSGRGRFRPVVAHRVHGVLLSENTTDPDTLLRRAIENAQVEELVTLNENSPQVPVRSTLVDPSEKLSPNVDENFENFEFDERVETPAIQVPRKTLGVKILRLSDDKARISADSD